MNREPFWWPMNEPPLPVDRNRSANRIEAGPNGRGFVRRIDPAVDLQVDPSVTEHAANQERALSIARRIAEENSELMRRLADG